MQRNGYIPPHVHMHLCRPHLVTKRVWVPQGPVNATKITHLGINGYIEYTALQTNLAYFKKLTTFTDININIGNHKSAKFTKNRPERLWPL